MTFLYSRRGICFICNEKFEFVSSQEENEGMNISFKIFFRYLGIPRFEDFPSGVNLCELCSSRMNEFWQLYQEFENLRLCMDDYVLSFCERMKTISENVSVSGKDRKLKEAVIRKCITTVNSLPVINLERVIISPVENMKVEISSPVLASIPQDIKMEVNDDIDDYPEDNDLPIDHHDEYSSDGKLPISKRVLKCVKSPHRKKSTVHGKYLRGKCDICNKVMKSWKNNCELEKHKVLKHLTEFYASKIPPGVTEPEIQEATKIILNKKKIYPSNEIGCPFCSGVYNAHHRFRYHVQSRHFDKVLLALNNPNDVSLQVIHATHDTTQDEEIRKIRNLKYDPNTSNQPFQCSICQESFEKLGYFKMHLRLVHTLTFLEDQLPSGTSEEELYTSIDTLLLGAKSGRKWSCPKCPKIFKKRLSLKCHFINSHLDKIIQKLKLSSSDEVTKVDKVVNNKYKCWTCGKSCFTQVKLVSHRKLSHPGPLIKCKFCDESFKKNDALVVHVMKIHSLEYFGNNIPPGTTAEELEKAIDKWICEKSQRNVHENRLRYKCSQCGVVLYAKSHVRRHALVEHSSQIIFSLSK